MSAFFGYVALLLQLVSGSRAIQAPHKPVGFERAAEYAVAAAYFGHRAGIDPYELLGVARNESDFVENTVGPDGKDCGLMQTRITVTHYSCRQLRSSAWLAFQEGARELKGFARSCRHHSDFQRCMLNRYNSGYRYARHGVHGAYWLRVQCFSDAARLGIHVGDACRVVRRRHDVTRILAQRTVHAVPAMARRAPHSRPALHRRVAMASRRHHPNG